MHKVTIQQQKVDLMRAKKKTDRMGMNSKHKYDTNDLPDWGDSDQKPPKRRSSKKVIKKMTKSTAQAKRNSRKLLYHEKSKAKEDAGDALPVRERGHERRPSNLENYLKLKEQRNKEYSMQKKLHEQYIRDKGKNDTKKLETFESIDKNNTSKVRQNLNRQNRSIQDRLRSRKNKSIIRNGKKKSELFLSHVDGLASLRIPKSLHEAKDGAGHKKTLEQSPEKQMITQSAVLPEMQQKRPEERVEFGKIPKTSLDKIDDDRAKHEDSEQDIRAIIESNIYQDEVKEKMGGDQGGERKESEQGDLGSGTEYERQEVLNETEDIGYQILKMQNLEDKKPEKKAEKEEETRPVEGEQKEEAESGQEAEGEGEGDPIDKSGSREAEAPKTEQVEEKGEEEETPKQNGIDQEAVIKIKFGKSSTEKKEDHKVESEERTEPRAQSGESSQKAELPQNEESLRSFKEEAVKSSSIREADDIILTKELSKQNSLEEGVETSNILAEAEAEEKAEEASALAMREDPAREAKGSVESKKKVKSKNLILKNKSNKFLKPSKRRLPKPKAKKISHKKNKSDINFSSHAGRVPVKPKKKRKSVGPKKKGNSYFDKLLEKKKQSERRQRNGLRKSRASQIANAESGKAAQDPKKRHVGNSIKAPAELGSSRVKKGRSPPKKSKMGKKKIKNKKNAGFDKYLKSPKNLISKFKSSAQ